MAHWAHEVDEFELPATSDDTPRSRVQPEQALRLAWNCTLPVNNLPVEILGSIFTSLMVVCCYWREVALTTWNLWRTLNPTCRSMGQWIDLCLARSAMATIDVDYLVVGANGPLHDHLFSHAHRIRSLHYGTIWRQNIPSTVSLLGEGMPALEVLKFPVDLRITHIGHLELDRLQDLSLTHRRFPRLTDISLRQVLAPCDIALFRNLQRLSLEHCTAKFSLKHFLGALGSSEALEVLELTGFLRHLSPLPQSPAGPASHCQSLQFPHLKKLSMTNHSPSLTSQFLSHLCIPSTALLLVYSTLTDISEDQVQETITAILPLDLTTSFPVLALATDAEVTVHGRTYGLRCCQRADTLESKDDYSRPHISSLHVPGPEVPDSHLVTLSIYSPSFCIWRKSLPKVLDDLLHTFASARLTSLRVNAYCQQADAATWERTFVHLPHLVSLTLIMKVSPDIYDQLNGTGGFGEADMLFDGLCNASLSIASHTVDPSGLLLQTACPGLKFISMETDGFIMPELLDSMIECLRCCVGQGVKLKRLEMEQQSAVTLRPAVRCAYVSALLEVVVELSFSRVVNRRREDYIDANGTAPSDIFEESEAESDEASNA
ncbi:hypothetical protein V8D89_000014 [Ganoderma adspersum]